MKILINIPENLYKSIKFAKKIYSDTSNDVITIPLKNIVDGVMIPDKATNKEILEALFPNSTIIPCAINYTTRILIYENEEWFNSLYKYGGDKDDTR